LERLRERLATAGQALRSLLEVLDMEKSPVVRDAAIQRFEYTFETVWKAAQLFLKEQEGIEAGSPKSVIRASFQSGLLGEDWSRAAMSMAEDRNLTVHTYNERLAETSYARIPLHARLMESWLAAMERHLREQRP
jgi:nucleotidyltransferase substrate binding protein (TIGR01987 family)